VPWRLSPRITPQLRLAASHAAAIVRAPRTRGPGDDGILRVTGENTGVQRWPWRSAPRSGDVEMPDSVPARVLSDSRAFSLGRLALAVALIFSGLLSGTYAECRESTTSPTS
jgi:hypothetical protein